MTSNEIKEKLMIKFNEPLTINLLTNYIIEFQECFGNFINVEEIINRLIKNVKTNFIIEEEIKSKSLKRKPRWNV